VSSAGSVRLPSACNMAARSCGPTYGTLAYAEMLRFARLQGIPESELRLTLLPLLASAGLIEFSVGPDGTPSEIVEQVGVGAPLLEQCDLMWEACGPLPQEAAAVQSAELGASRL